MNTPNVDDQPISYWKELDALHRKARAEKDAKLSQLRAEVERLTNGRDFLIATLQRELDEARAWQAEIRDAIHRSGMGIMRTSQGPSGTMLGYRPEVEEEHDRKTLEVIHENVDLAAEVRTLKAQLAEREEDRALLDEVQKRKLTIAWNPRHGGFIIQEQEQVCGNIAHNSDLRAAIRAARAQPEDGK